MHGLRQKIARKARAVERVLKRRKLLSISEAWECDTYGSDQEECFFGYYDYTPFRPGCDQEFIYQSVPVGGKPATSSSTFLFRSKEGEVLKFGSTNAWGWQIGSRLQWVDQNTVSAANYREGRGYFTQFIDIRDGHVCDTLDDVFFDADFTAGVGVSIDMERLQKFRPGYGYESSGGNPNVEDENDSAIWVTDLLKGESACFLTYRSARELDQNVIFKCRKNVSYFNHVKLSPNGDKFIVFHIVLSNGRRFSRCLIGDIGSKNVRVLHCDGQVSHYCWITNHKLLLTVGLSDHFDWRIIDTDTGEWRSFSMPQFKLDGHPSLNPRRPELIVFDHYPDRMNERVLRIFNSSSGEIEIVGNFFSPPHFAGELKCDLHPRWSREGNSIAVDSTHNGLRSFNVLRRV